MSEPGAHLSLSGQNAAGRTLLFWEFDRSFRRLVNDWLSETDHDQMTQFTIQVDMERGTCAHARTTRQQAAATKLADEQRAMAVRRAAPRDHTPVGFALAAQVAARLDQGATLAYAHRDYCGLGLTRPPRATTTTAPCTTATSGPAPS